MHVPDGFLAPVTWMPAAAVAAGTVGVAARRVRRDLREETLPRLAVLTALAFVVSSVAVPLPGGTSAHASGVALLALQFGVGTAYLAYAGVLALQALGFGIGGVTSLPVNALCLGLAGGAAAALAYRALRRTGERPALFAAGWLSVVVPASLLAVVLGVQPLLARTPEGAPLFFPFGLGVTLPALALPHVLVGLGEGALTVAVSSFLPARARGRPGGAKP